MRLREDFEPPSGVERRQLQCTRQVGDLLVPFSTLALQRRKPARRRADEPGIKPADLCCFLNDDYQTRRLRRPESASSPQTQCG